MDRTVTRCAQFITVVLAAGLAETSPARAQVNVNVSGTTFEMDPAGNYSAVGGVGIKLIQNQGVNHMRPSDPNGHFNFSVAAGPPFSVLFVRGGKVPEVSQLAGLGGLGDIVHVTLLTPAQYSKFYGSDALRAQEQRVMAAVAKDAEMTAEMRRIFQQMW
jgi:hypothetical protein